MGKNIKLMPEFEDLSHSQKMLLWKALEGRATITFPRRLGRSLVIDIMKEYEKELKEYGREKDEQRPGRNYVSGSRKYGQKDQTFNG